MQHLVTALAGLAGAIVGGSFVLVGQILSQRAARERAGEQRAHERELRLFDTEYPWLRKRIEEGGYAVALMELTWEGRDYRWAVQEAIERIAIEPGLVRRYPDFWKANRDLYEALKLAYGAEAHEVSEARKQLDRRFRRYVEVADELAATGFAR